MATNISGNSQLRFSGMATGLDIDGMVQKLMKIEKTRVDKVKQDKQVLEWKQNDYRDVTNLLRGFKDKFVDILSPTSLRSADAYKSFSNAVSPGNPTLDTGAVSITTNADAVAGTHSIIVKQLASAQVKQSGSAISKDVTGDGTYTLNAGETFNLTIDGTTKTIKLSGTTVASLNMDIANAFGGGKVVVDDTTNLGKLTFKAASTTNGVNQISVSAGTTSNALTNMGFGANAILSNRLSGSETLSAISAKLNTPLTFTTLSDGTTQGIKLNINGKAFEFSSSTKLSDMMNQISSDATANVTMQYDSVNNGFKLIAKQAGLGENIALNETGSNFITATDISQNKAGTDAQVNLDGVDITRSSNTFTVSGITYNISKVTTDGITDRPVSVSVSQDVDAVYNRIKGFVDEYNKMIDTLNTKLSEDHDRNYSPLTDDQKAAMKDTDIEAWEKKAKAGLLRSDSILENITNKMRQAIYSDINGVTGGLYSIGIKTGTWDQKGKLVIDETKLKDAIRNQPDKVKDIFSKESTKAYSPNLTPADRQTRFDESGIVARLSDVIDDNIRTSRDSNNKKGILLEKAGITGDASIAQNTLYSQISDKDDIINDLLVKLSEKENNYYKQFSAMETAINKMNSQSAWMSQQMGG